MNRIQQPMLPSALRCDDAPMPGLPVDLARADLDDATVAYVLEMRPAFDLLRQCAGQLAGLALLAVAGARRIPDYPLLDLARKLLDEAADAIWSVRIPERGRHHHHHLTNAMEALRTALGSASDHLHRPEEVDGVLMPLKTGYKELQWATGALPGFEMVAFGQACCAVHAARQRDRLGGTANG